MFYKLHRILHNYTESLGSYNRPLTILCSCLWQYHLLNTSNKQQLTQDDRTHLCIKYVHTVAKQNSCYV